jgi:opacity protein-like surface antigen
MRRSPTQLNAPISAVAFAATLLLASIVSVAAHAQQNPGIEIRGVGMVGYMPSFQDSDLAGSSLDDGQGLKVNLGFSTGDMFTWMLGYELAMDSNYNTHFFPVTMRMYDPWLLLPFFEDDTKLPFGLRTFADASLGLFFTQVSGKFGPADNKRASAWRLGGGIEVDLMDNLAGFIDAGWTEGLGSANSYQYGSVGVGVVYRWDL